MTGLFNKAVQAYKKGKYIKATGNTNMYKAAKEVQKLNQLSEMMENMLEKQIDINNHLNNDESKIHT